MLVGVGLRGCRKVASALLSIVFVEIVKVKKEFKEDLIFMIKFEELKKTFSQDKLNDLEITKYLTLTQKNFIFEGTEEETGLINSILKEENNLWFIDRYSYEVHLAHIILNWYGNVQFEQFSVDEYDFVQENGVLNFIINQVDDYYKFTNMLDNILQDELEKRNSLEGIVARGLEKLMDKLDDLTDDKKMAKMVKQMKKAVDGNPQLLELLQLEKLQGVVDKNKKVK